jgi:hypothetical protein
MDIVDEGTVVLVKTAGVLVCGQNINFTFINYEGVLLCARN